MAFVAGQGVAQTEQAGILVVAAPPATTVTAVFSQFAQPGRRVLTGAIIATLGVISAPFVPTAATPAFAAFSQPSQKKRIALDQPTQTPFTAFQPYVFSQFSQPTKNKIIVLEDSASWLEQEFIPPQVYVFTQFSQPLVKRNQFIADTSPWLEQEPPIPVIWGWNGQFSQPLKKPNLAITASWTFTPFTPLPPDPYVPETYRKRKHKKKPHDLVELQIKEREDRLKDIELAVYGPPIEYQFRIPDYILPTPVNPGNLPQIMLAVQQNKIAQAKAREDAEDEAEIEDILKEL